MFVVFRFFERYGFGVVCSDGRQRALRRQHVHRFNLLYVLHGRQRAWRRCGWKRCGVET